MMKTLFSLLACSLLALPQAYAQNTVYGTGAGNGGNSNTHIGYNAGKVSTASFNAFLGHTSGSSNTTGSNNTFLGFNSGGFNTTGSANTFLGVLSGYFNTTGNANTFLGGSSGTQNTTGFYNTFLGHTSGSSNTTGNTNTFLGFNSGGFNTTGSTNTFLGANSGNSNTTGNFNTILGEEAGYNNQSGNKNVFLGYKAGYSETGSNKLYIDNNNDNNPLLYGNFSTNVLSVGTKYTGTTYKLVVPGKVRATAYDVVSDERLKKEVKRLQDVLAKVQQIEGVRYALKEDSTAKAAGQLQYGFLAQNVKRVFPELVTEDEGMLAVNYQGMIPVLVEAIKELSLQKETMQTENLQMKQELLRVNEELTAIKKALGLSHHAAIGSLLEQNSSNPFDQVTAIRYQASAQAKQVSLLITDLQGLEVQRFNHLQPGQGQVEIAAGSLPAGTYIYTLIVDGKPLASQKMVLTR